MTVTLSARNSAMVGERLRDGGYATPDEVVNALIEEAFEEILGVEYDAVRVELLSTVGKPTHPYRKGLLAEMMRQELAKEAKA